jgi:hypothetical protein
MFSPFKGNLALYKKWYNVFEELKMEYINLERIHSRKMKTSTTKQGMQRALQIETS